MKREKRRAYKRKWQSDARYAKRAAKHELHNLQHIDSSSSVEDVLETSISVNPIVQSSNQLSQINRNQSLSSDGVEYSNEITDEYNSNNEPKVNWDNAVNFESLSSEEESGNADSIKQAGLKLSLAELLNAHGITHNAFDDLLNVSSIGTHIFLLQHVLY